MSSQSNTMGDAASDRYYFFYSKKSSFSNFHPATFVCSEGNKFFCSEQYMMYHKALQFGDKDIAAKILKEKDQPLVCKKLGRQVKNFDAQVWNDKAQHIVEEGVYLKFTQDKALKRELLATNELEMVEASPRDRIWGIGYSASEALTVPRSSWGSNWLGKILMIARERIRLEEEEEKKLYLEELNNLKK